MSPNKIKIKIEGYELVQSIQLYQSAQNVSSDTEKKSEVTLLQGKDTFLRVYYSHENDYLKDFEEFTCELSVDFTGSSLSGKKFQLLNHVTVEQLPDPENQRFNFRKSLNFKIPAKYLSQTGSNLNNTVDIKFTLHNARLRNKQSEWIEARRFFNGKRTLEIKKTFQPPSVLLIRLVGYRYSDFEQLIEEIPRESDFRVLKEFIQTAFPVSELKWSHVTIDAPREFRKLRNTTSRDQRVLENIDLVYSLMFQHLLAVRNQDISQNIVITQDQCGSFELPTTSLETVDSGSVKTLYLGLINDPTGRLGGAAMKIPGYPSSHVVAFTEPDSEGVLGAHELAHLLGRPHPGIPNKAIHGRFIGQSNQYDDKSVFCRNCQSSSDAQNDSLKEENLCINKLGLISFEQCDYRKIALGLDHRKSITNANILRHDENFDLMTYRFPQWVSPHTYEGLLERINAINNEIVHHDYDKKNQNQDSVNIVRRYLNVIGEYNLSSRDGKISFTVSSVFNTEKNQDQEESDSENNSELELEYCYLHEDFFLLLYAGLIAKKSSLDLVNCFHRQGNESNENFLERLFPSEEFTAIDIFSHLDEFVKMIFVQLFITKRCDFESDKEHCENDDKPLEHIYFELLWRYAKSCCEDLSISTKDINRTDTNPLLGVFQKSIEITGNKFPISITLKYKGISIDKFEFFRDEYCHIEPEKRTDNDEHNVCSNFPLCLEYDVDRSSFYFNYNWNKLVEFIENYNQVNPVSLQENIALSEVISSLSLGEEGKRFFEYINLISLKLVIDIIVNIITNLISDGVTSGLELPITTTIQFKPNKEITKRNPDHGSVGGEWQTVGVSNHIKDRIWLAPQITGRLNARGRDEVTSPDDDDYYTFDSIRDIFTKSYCEHGIEFRVLLSYFSLTIVLFESTNGKIFKIPDLEKLPDKIIPTIKGSLGEYKENYHIPIRKEKDENRDYYRPTVPVEEDDGSCSS